MLLRKLKKLPISIREISSLFLIRFSIPTSFPVGKIAKKQSKGVLFFNSVLTVVPCCQKYTLTDCFFGDRIKIE